MNKKSILLKAEKLFFKKGTFAYRVCKLLKNGDFINVLSSRKIVDILNEETGKKIKVNSLTASMNPLLEEGIVKVKIIRKGRNKGKFWLPGWIDKKQVKFEPIEESSIHERPFSKKLIKTMGRDFGAEVTDITLVYGKSGTCTAFLLRKILEKMIFLTFAKNGLSNQLIKEERIIGLKAMLSLATTKKIQGKPFLMSKTAKEIGGIKFLGDTSAHNPLTNVEMKTILPQMPFIITAYEELSKKL